MTDRADDIRLVFDHYRTYHPRSHRTPVSTAKEWRLISGRMKEGSTVEDLCLAIDGCHMSPFHQGVNDRGTKYDSLALIMRDASHVEQFIEIASAGSTARALAGSSEKEIRSRFAMEQWAREIDEGVGGNG